MAKSITQLLGRSSTSPEGVARGTQRLLNSNKSMALCTFVVLGLCVAQLLSLKRSYFSNGSDQIKITNTDRQINNLKVNEENEIFFEVENLHNSPARLLGGQADCGCLMPEDMPILIPPFGKRYLKVVAKPGNKGVFQAKVTVYTSDRKNREIQLNVRGKAS